MLDLLNRFRRNENGIATVELAVVTPIFLLMFLSSIELGHMIWYSITVEKGLRSAVTYAGRIEVHDATTRQNVKNIVMTGSPTGTAFLVAGWNDPDAQVLFEEKTYTTTTLTGTGNTVEVVMSVTADVPYVSVVGVIIPALEYLMRRSMRNGKLFITLTHQQAIIGN